MGFVVLRVAVLVYVGFTVLLFFLQGKMIFPGGRDVHTTPDAFGWAYEDVEVDVNGQQTCGWYLPVEGARGTVLFSHGNAGTIADRLESIGIFRDLGFNVLIYDYGGYGRSTGRPSETRCYADVRAMWAWLTDTRGVPPERVVLFGRSLGSGPAVQLATEVQPGAVIIESPFLSTVRLGKELFPILPVKLLIRHRFDNESKVGNVSAPLLVIHSRTDEIIPFRHGQALFERANEPKTFLEIRGTHNDGFYTSGSLYIDGLRAFLHPLFSPADAETPAP